jgi:hypothetical protein
MTGTFTFTGRSGVFSYAANTTLRRSRYPHCITLSDGRVRFAIVTGRVLLLAGRRDDNLNAYDITHTV